MEQEIVAKSGNQLHNLAFQLSNISSNWGEVQPLPLTPSPVITLYMLHMWPTLFPENLWIASEEHRTWPQVHRCKHLHLMRQGFHGPFMVLSGSNNLKIFQVLSVTTDKLSLSQIQGHLKIWLTTRLPWLCLTVWCGDITGLWKVLYMMYGVFCHINNYQYIMINLKSLLGFNINTGSLIYVWLYITVDTYSITW